MNAPAQITEDELTGTLIKPNGLETPYRIGTECGDVFEEGYFFDGITVTIAVDSLEEGRTLVAALDAYTRATRCMRA